MGKLGFKKKIDRKLTVKLIVWAVLLAAASVISFYSNPLDEWEEELAKKIISCVMILVAGVVFTVKYDKITTLPVELYQNRHLIWKLAKNDFKKRYAGSYMGAVWALVQPVVTVAMYFIVFELIFPNQRGSGSEVPFVVFLTCGLVPWFFFSEALNNGTNALLEYNYLVKKVVFKISILPIIKVVAALFIHSFFVLVMLILASIFGYYPTFYTLQIIYYSFCLFIFVLALSYTTCAVCVFFRDITQIIAILLQLGMWATPIMWDLEAMNNPVLTTVIKINPLVYIVNGYRNSVYGGVWFFEDFFSTMYFWIVTVLLFGFGALVFKRLKVHFADVL